MPQIFWRNFCNICKILIKENEQQKSNNYFQSIYWNSFGEKKIASDTRFYIQKLLGEYLLAMNEEVNTMQKKGIDKENNKFLNLILKSIELKYFFFSTRFLMLKNRFHVCIQNKSIILESNEKKRGRKLILWCFFSSPHHFLRGLLREFL